MKSTSNSMEQKCTLVENRGSVKGCLGGSNELPNLKIKILYIKKYFFYYLALLFF